MTNINELFSGVGVVIDEEINAQNENPNGIQKIVRSLEDKSIPVLKFEELPSNDMLRNFHSISFVILDWNLSGVHPIPQVTIADNIDFINELKKICFVPLFIFSDEDPHAIKVSLEGAGIKLEKTPIFIERKEELDNADKLFSEIETWIKNTPSIYVLKEWENVTRKAKSVMMTDLSSISPSWPSVLANSYKDDSGDIDFELLTSLQNNLSYRIEIPKFDNEIVNPEQSSISKEEIRSILECERFIPNEKLPDYPFAGDVFTLEDGYYINIRPDCDIIREKKDLYLLKGNIVDETTINSDTDTKGTIIFNQGNFQEKINQCIVAFVDGKILNFSLRKLTIEKWNEIKSKRLGRLLPPFITKIQQKHSAYLQRQGLPRIPEEAIQ